MVQNLWDSSRETKLNGGLDALVFRSNLLGEDRRVCNFGGGNTSSKTIELDFRGREVEVMWVKGSGSDLATMKAGNFTGLRLQDIAPLFERDEMPDEENYETLAGFMMYIRVLLSKRYCMHFYLSSMWIIRIQMPLSVYAALITVRKLPVRFMGIVSYGCHTSVQASLYPK